jgi:hypothetical protein
MPIIAQGASTPPLSAYIPGPADFDASPVPTVTVLSLAGVVQAGFPATGLVHDGLGLYHYVWAVPLAQAQATYDVHFQGNVNGVAWDGWDTVEVVAAGSVPTGTWCTSDDVKTRLAGNPAFVPNLFNASIATIIGGVSARLNREIGRLRGARGPYSVIADSAASDRRYAARVGAPRLLPIDDCVEVDSVTDNGQPLTLGVDYDVYPLNGPVIEGLIRLTGCWSAIYGGTTVTAKWGLMTTLDEQLWDDAVSESVSVYLSARAGHDDTIGMDAFGKVVSAKALLSKTYHDIRQYAHGGAALR